MRLGHIVLALVVGLLHLVASDGASAVYPERLIRVLVTTAPGTATDIVARVFSAKLAEQLGQTVIVENKPGANGSVAVTELARATPDGYTLLVIPSGTMVANIFLYPKSATAALSDISPVAQLVSNDFFIAARPGLNIKSFAALLAHIRQTPGKVNVATSSHGSYPNIAAEMLKRFGELDFLIVTHNGGAAAASAVVGEHLDVIIDAGAVVGPFISTGKLVLLASTGQVRSQEWPDLPTVLESGVKDYIISGFMALAAPKDTPQDIRQTLYKAVAAAAADPTVRSRMGAMQLLPLANSPEELEKTIASDRARLGRVLRSAGE